MPAYVISDVSLKDDTVAVTAYRTRAADSIARYGGRYIVRGGSLEALEGNWLPRMLIVVEFPDIATARAWYKSPEYAQALTFRDKALTRNLLLLDGVLPPQV
jgi:uncharacterized protein (DUF1330 family)